MAGLVYDEKRNIATDIIYTVYRINIGVYIIIFPHLDMFDTLKFTSYFFVSCSHDLPEDAASKPSYTTTTEAPITGLRPVVTPYILLFLVPVTSRRTLLSNSRLLLKHPLPV